MSSLLPVPPGPLPSGIRRRASARAITEVGLKSWHTFAAAGDGYRELVSLEEYALAPGASIVCPSTETAPELEVLMLMLEGTLTYEDSHSRAAVITAGDVLHVSVAKGLCFTESNPSPHTARVLRLSLNARGPGREPRRVQRRFSAAQRHGAWCLVGSHDGRRSSLRIDQDASVFVTTLSTGRHVIHPLASDRAAWLHVVRGSISLGDERLHEGDSTNIEGQVAVSITARSASELLLIELAAPDRSS